MTIETRKLDHFSTVKNTLRRLVRRFHEEEAGKTLLGLGDYDGVVAEVVGALIEYVEMLEERVAALEGKS